MEIKMPIPNGQEIVIYHYERSFPNLTSFQLEHEFKPIKKDLDTLMVHLPQSDVVLFGYHIFLQRQDKDEYIIFMSGGIDITVKEGKNSALPGFVKDYSRNFKDAVDNFPLEQLPITLYIDLYSVTSKKIMTIESKFF